LDIVTLQQLTSATDPVFLQLGLVLAGGWGQSYYSWRNHDLEMDQHYQRIVHKDGSCRTFATF
jgi:hypothetical protein